MTITKEKIEQDKQPKTITQEPTLIEGDPRVDQAVIDVYKKAAQYNDYYLIRRLYGSLHRNMIHKTSDDLLGRSSLLADIKVLFRGIANYAEKHPEQIPELCAALAGMPTLKESWQMNAKEAIHHIRNTPIDDLKGFIENDLEARKTVLEAWEKKQEQEMKKTG